MSDQYAPRVSFPDLDAFEDQVRSALTGVTEGDLRVLAVDVVRGEDPEGASIWHVLLHVPRPGRSQDAWDLDSSLRLQRRGREVVDASAEQWGATLPGLTSVAMTTDDVEVNDIAPDDEPEDVDMITRSPSGHGS